MGFPILFLPKLYQDLKELFSQPLNVEKYQFKVIVISYIYTEANEGGYQGNAKGMTKQ